MKTLLKLMMALTAVAFLSFRADAQTDKKANKQTTVVYKADIHCNDCRTRIEKAIPFEKGVKDVKIDQAKGLVTIVFDASKTNKDNLKKAFDKIKIPAAEAKMCTNDPSKVCNCKDGKCDCKGGCKGGCKECKEGKTTKKECSGDCSKCEKNKCGSECGSCKK